MERGASLGVAAAVVAAVAAVVIAVDDDGTVALAVTFALVAVTFVLATVALPRDDEVSAGRIRLMRIAALVTIVLSVLVAILVLVT